MYCKQCLWIVYMFGNVFIGISASVNMRVCVCVSNVREKKEMTTKITGKRGTNVNNRKRSTICTNRKQ